MHASAMIYSLRPQFSGSISEDLVQVTAKIFNLVSLANQSIGVSSKLKFSRTLNLNF